MEKTPKPVRDPKIVYTKVRNRRSSLKGKWAPLRPINSLSHACTFTLGHLCYFVFKMSISEISRKLFDYETNMFYHCSKSIPIYPQGIKTLHWYCGCKYIPVCIRFIVKLK